MAPYSNDPRPNPYANIPSPFPNIDFPAPYWINKLANMAIIGCLDPDLVYAELAVAAAAKMGWTLITPSTKQLIEEASGSSWICGSRQTLHQTQWGNEIATSDSGRFVYGALAGLDIAAYHAFMLSTGAEGVIDFGSYAAKFQRVCNGDNKQYRGLNPIGGWPVPSNDWATGPSFDNNSGHLVGPGLTVEKGQIWAMIVWCSFSDLFSSGGVVVNMRIIDLDSNTLYDFDTVNNLFNTSQFAVVRAFSTEGRALRDTNISCQILCTEAVGSRMVPVNGGCFMRAWDPDAGDAPPYWNMKTMLKQKGG
jgi:hypothetical protein